MNAISKRNENLVVYSLMLYAIWSFFTGFRIGFNDFFDHWYYGLPHIILQIVLISYFWFCYIKKSLLYDKKYLQLSIIYLAGYSFLIISSTSNCISTFGRFIFVSLIGSFFILLKDDIKTRILYGYITILAVIFLLSVTEYIYIIATGNKIILFVSNLKEDQGLFDQTLFNIIPDYMPVFRFQSLAEEPGCVGTMSAFMLYTTYGVKKMRWHYYIFLLSGLLSMSFAFYLMLFFHLLTSGVVFSKKIAFVLILIVVLFSFVGDIGEMFGYRVLDRATSGEADNRSSEQLDKVLKERLEDGSILFGGFTPTSSSAEISGAGAKRQIYQYGLFGVVMWLLCYSHIYLNMLRKNKPLKYKHCICFLIVFILSYYQREYIDRIEFVVVFFTMTAFVKKQEQLEIGVISKS